MPEVLHFDFCAVKGMVSLTLSMPRNSGAYVDPARRAMARLRADNHLVLINKPGG